MVTLSSNSEEVLKAALKLPSEREKLLRLEDAVIRTIANPTYAALHACDQARHSQMIVWVHRVQEF